MKRYTVGVDVGGTNIKLGLVNSSGEIMARDFLETKQFYKNKRRLIDAVGQKIVLLLESKNLGLKQVAGIGFGLPGLVDPQKGIVNFLPNIEGWRNVPLRKIAQDQLKVPVCIDNDVNMITLGEWRYGAGQGYHNLMCMTLGTGVGAGLILNDTLYRGEGYVAGELGHMPLNECGPKCNCGGWGCFETYVGNGRLLHKASKVFKNKKIELPDIYQLASEGNQKALKFWKDTAGHIGNGLIGIVNLLNPRLIIIGGGVSNNFTFLKKEINTIIRDRAMKVQAKMVRVVRAQLGDDAGIIGAHVLVKESIGDR